MWKKYLKRRNLSNWLVAIGFSALTLGLLVWTYAYPVGYRECYQSEMRNFLVGELGKKGFSVECRKENSAETRQMVSYPLRNFNQFTEWARTLGIVMVYEQPGYFWFLRSDHAPGFVKYEY